MADHEDETFENVDAGASKTYPMQAGSIRKGGHLVIKNRPCKVVEVSTSKTGKHGHAKCHFVATDIFTGKKYEELTPSSHNCEVPNIDRSEFSVIDINDEGYVTLMDDNGNTREDLQLPKGTEDLEKVADAIKDNHANGEEIIVVVTKALGEEMILQCKVVNT